MKRKSVTANYEFTTGDERYRDSMPVTLKYDHEGQFTEEEESKQAIEEVTKWFDGRYPEAVLQSVVINHPITVVLKKDYDPTHNKVGNCGYRVSGPGIDIPFGWFTAKDFPFVDPATAAEPDGELSDLVLIDLDGNQENFVTGLYHFPYTLDGEHTEGWWRVDPFYQESLNLKKMRWSYLDLGRYKKK